jgi:flagellar biosynthesis/type III secretory pathway protein FliH
MSGGNFIMTDRQAVLREIADAIWLKADDLEITAIALRHIEKARAEGYDAGLKAGFYEGVKAAHENIGLPQEPPA